MQLTEGNSSAEESAKIQQDMKDQMSKMNSEIGSLKDMMKNFLASQSAQNTEVKLPAQPIANPKQCGAISTSNAVTTRSGKLIEPQVGKPSAYVPLARRTLQESGNVERAREPQGIPIEQIRESSREEVQGKDQETELNQVKIPFPA